jgi:hypothetical protein
MIFDKKNNEGFIPGRDMQNLINYFKFEFL